VRITKFNLYRYSISLKSPVKLARTLLHKREGLVLQLTDDSGHSGFGEIAPFPGFSRETLGEAESEIKNILTSSSEGKKSPGRRCESPDSNRGTRNDGSRVIQQILEQLSADNLTKTISAAFPSVRFGIESAVIDLKAKFKGMGIAKLLNEKSRDGISINGLLTGSKEGILKKADEYSRIGYRAVKLKVGSGKLEDDIELTKLVRNAIGDKVVLRLDANRCWQMNDAQKFCDAVAGFHIDYLEEPLADSSALEEALNNRAFDISIALDETTREISPEELRQYNVKAIVLKPTLLGFQSTIDFAQSAHQLGITPVIGSSFESGLGLSILAQIAAAVNTDDIPAGLDTYSWFVDDIINGSLPVKNGRINLNDLADPETVLDSPLLKKLI